MSEMSNVVEQAEIEGGVVLPSVVALGYGVYLLLAVDSHSSNGLLLLALGGLSLLSTFLAMRWPLLTWFPIVLGWYTFGILGCLGLGLAIVEWSGWWAAGAGLFWLLFGWYVLNRASKFRRFVRNSS